MSNPWSTLTPGGVPVSRPVDDGALEDWIFEPPTALVFDQSAQSQVPFDLTAGAGEVSTDVDINHRDRPAADTVVAAGGSTPAALPPVATPTRGVEASHAAAVVETADDCSEDRLALGGGEQHGKKAARTKAPSRAARPVAITLRDISILVFLGRYRFATYAQIARAFGTSQSTMRHRLPRLAREGLVRCETIGKTAGKSGFSVWLPTRVGLQLAGIDLPTPTLSWATAVHTSGLVDIGIKYEASGEAVVTEREIRAADTRDRPSDRMRSAMQYAVRNPVSTAAHDHDDETAAGLYVVRMARAHYGHIPDMVLSRPRAADGTPRSMAIELELTRKPPAEWRRILPGYLGADNIAEVIYYTHSAKIRDGILDAAKEVGAEGIVTIRRFRPSEDSAVQAPTS